MRFLTAKQANGYRKGYWQVVDNVTHTSMGSFFLETDAQSWAEQLEGETDPCGCWHEDQLVWPCNEHARVYKVTHQFTVIARNEEDAIYAGVSASAGELPEQLYIGEDRLISEVDRIERVNE